MNKHFEGEDLETRVRQLEEEIVSLRSDSSLRNLPYGTLKEAKSIFTVRTDGGVYPVGMLCQNVALGTVAPGANSLKAIPFWLPGVPNLITKIGLKVTTLSAGAIRLGIYADKGEPTLYPHRLVLDAGTVNVGATGVKSGTLRQSLPRGLYWLAMIGNSTPTISAFASYGWVPLGYSEAGVANTYLAKAETYGALPNPFPAGATAATAALPYVFLVFS